MATASRQLAGPTWSPSRTRRRPHVRLPETVSHLDRPKPHRGCHRWHRRHTPHGRAAPRTGANPVLTVPRPGFGGKWDTVRTSCYGKQEELVRDRVAYKCHVRTGARLMCRCQLEPSQNSTARQLVEAQRPTRKNFPLSQLNATLLPLPKVLDEPTACQRVSETPAVHTHFF